MRISGILAVLASVLFCAVLRAETSKPVLVPEPARPGPRSPAAPTKLGSASGDRDGDRSSCTLVGTATPDLDLHLVDGDGRAVARFGGVPLPLTISELPEKADGKVRVTTGGNARLRVTGYVAVRSIPLHLTQDLSIVQGHVSLLRGSPVEYAGRSGNQIRITVRASHPMSDSYSATVPCDGLVLESQKAGKWAPPGHARGYLMKQQVTPLFDKPGSDAAPVASLHLAADARGVLMFGDRREGDFIHVLYHRDLAVDGWMSAKDLDILPRGEVADQSASKLTPPTDRRLEMKADGQLYRALRDIPLFGKADAKLPPIGSVSKDAELYVLDVIVGWANVLPKQLDIVPLADRHFWVKANELGL